MDSTKSTLTDAEVNQIAQLIETLDRSTLDFLQIDSGGLKVTIGKGNAIGDADRNRTWLPDRVPAHPDCR